MEEKRVFMVGYMGVGKSTSGARLAKLMGLPFFDTDAVLSQRHGCSITHLFEEQGEPAFRTMERDVLHDLVQDHQQVLISTGGGTPCHADNMEFMRSQGTVVYLQMPADALVMRLEGKADQRPLIAGVSAEALPAFVAQHLAEREPFYSQSHITVDARHFDRDRMKSVRNLVERRAWFSPSRPPRPDQDR
ncbi:MAG: shikimate kinase [Crocinitomicaceae bacterium TMED114]|nr:MAG: shikimate kinase [Crocinitomicaceae bacterium TMED114]|tara:strand:- start:886 stop:1455 length:570 start_codon:yes stop_codon:yes gene_type:complete